MLSHSLASREEKKINISRFSIWKTVRFALKWRSMTSYASRLWRLFGWMLILRSLNSFFRSLSSWRKFLWKVFRFFRHTLNEKKVHFPISPKTVACHATIKYVWSRERMIIFVMVVASIIKCCIKESFLLLVVWKILFHNSILSL